MASGRWTTRGAEPTGPTVPVGVMRRALRAVGSALLRAVVPALGCAACVLGAGVSAAAPAAEPALPPPRCDRPVYLSFDTGHMGVAELIADVLRRHQVKATFFAAQERTQVGDGTLGEHWASWWRARAAEGHEFAAHTWDHVVWRADVPGAPPRWRMRPTAGPQAGQESTWTPQAYCAQLRQASERLRELTGKAPLPLFRAPGGRTSPSLLAAAQGCGFRHVGWAPAGFLGDELPSERWPNDALLAQALRDIRPGDILVAHLGIWSRREPWAPAVLEPLITGLKARGMCFATLREHPAYRDWIRQPG